MKLILSLYLLIDIELLFNLLIILIIGLEYYSQLKHGLWIKFCSNNA